MVVVFLKKRRFIISNCFWNKFRKLKYILKKTISNKIPVIATFGGAFSNHLPATAAAGKKLGLKTIGFVRGEEWKNKIMKSSTLSFCHSQDMKLVCLSRKAILKKNFLLK